jgi:hypothetical protein
VVVVALDVVTVVTGFGSDATDPVRVLPTMIFVFLPSQTYSTESSVIETRSPFPNLSPTCPVVVFPVRVSSKNATKASPSLTIPVSTMRSSPVLGAVVGT